MTTPQPGPYDGWSDSDIKAAQARNAAELARRAAQDAETRALRLNAELAEIEAGTRLPQAEHVAVVGRARGGEQKVSEWVNSGALEHMGIGRPRRRSWRGAA